MNDRGSSLLEALIGLSIGCSVLATALCGVRIHYRLFSAATVETGIELRRERVVEALRSASSAARSFGPQTFIRGFPDGRVLDYRRREIRLRMSRAVEGGAVSTLLVYPAVIYRRLRLASRSDWFCRERLDNIGPDPLTGVEIRSYAAFGSDSAGEVHASPRPIAGTHVSCPGGRLYRIVPRPIDDALFAPPLPDGAQLLVPLLDRVTFVRDEAGDLRRYSHDSRTVQTVEHGIERFSPRLGATLRLELEIRAPRGNGRRQYAMSFPVSPRGDLHLADLFW